MSTTVRLDFNVNEILAKRGLGADNKAQKFLCNEVWRMSDQYTPMEQGMLKGNVSLASDGSYLEYNSPYARYLWYGKVMVGKAPKQATDKPLQFEGSPLRGSFWVNRCWSSRGKEIINAVTSITGGQAK